MMLILRAIFTLFPLLLLGQHPIASFNWHTTSFQDSVKSTNNVPITAKWIKTPRTIRIEDYFEYMDSLVVSNDSLGNAGLNEHIIVHLNPWIIDTLYATDYYVKKAKDSFVYNQKKMIVFRSGDSILIPGIKEIDSLQKSFAKLHLEVNIPEYRLRIFREDSLLFNFPIRVGQNRKRYLAMSKRMTNLRTLQGTGKIIAHHKNPVYYNPVNMKRYHKTNRDDGKTTLLPRIPWLETIIDGVRNGQMIHPTTNPETLGSAYSNGCIGTKECDAWIIYYYAPVSTPINIKYELIVKGIDNKKLQLEDIYHYEH
ncbi:L,D-transpeptidase [Ascidiimonas sp. W6]|uniref:L,D-transpeptidase n=1 Tax=Ascidiimonas meishanensis TaxID=3128903 RepID=UPI0030EE41CE